MLKCPKCSKEFEKFYYTSFHPEKNCGGFASLKSINGEMEFDYKQKAEMFDKKPFTNFFCPKCSKLLFENEIDAKKFSMIFLEDDEIES
jgi:hypothetical protein